MENVLNLDPVAIEEALKLFLCDGQVTELRCLSPSRTLVGFYDRDHASSLVRDAIQASRISHGIYFIPNPVNPALLARGANRLIDSAKAATADADIVSRRYLLIDLDPDRPSGISSSENEHQMALELAESIQNSLSVDGWPDPVRCDSGNGAHLIYRVDLPRDDNGLIQRVLKALAHRFDTDLVHIDKSVYNPARIWKLPGTVAKKGENMADRPHRLSKILFKSKLDASIPLPLLDDLVARFSPPASKQTAFAGILKSDSDFALAVDRYESENSHRVNDWPTKPGPCPACGSSGSFHRYPPDSLRWLCFSDRHNSVGMPGIKSVSGKWVGNILDLDCHSLGVTAVDHLKAGGYLAANKSYSTAQSSTSPTIITAPTRVPPNDQDAESAILGCILDDYSTLTNISEILESSDFYRGRHSEIYKIALELSDVLDPVDVVTVSAKLKSAGLFEAAGGMDYLNELITKKSPSKDVLNHCKIVRARSMARQIISAGKELIDGCYDNPDGFAKIAESAERQIMEITKRAHSAPVHTLKDVLKERVPKLEEMAASGQALTGVTSGLRDLDDKTCGFQPSDLVILAARPSVGKTCLALNMITAAALRQSIPAVLFSIEMPREQIADRLLACESSIDLQALRTGRIKERSWQDLRRCRAMLDDVPIWIDDTPAISLREMRSKARRLKSQFNIGLVVVDYIGLMDGKTGKNSIRREDLGILSRGLKALARELKIPVIVLSQLSRKPDDRNDKRPILSDLRECGDIEQDADVVLLLYRESMSNEKKRQENDHTTEIIIAKQRNGPLWTVKAGYHPNIGKFFDLVGEH